MPTSHADVHTTLKTLVANLKGNVMNGIEETTPGLGMDLLTQKLPENRTCANASVPEGLCLLVTSWAAGTSEICRNFSRAALQSAKNAVVDHINTVTGKYTAQCSHVESANFGMDYCCIQQASTATIHLEMRLRQLFESVVVFAGVRHTRGISTVLHLTRQTSYSAGPCIEALMQQQPPPGNLFENCVCAKHSTVLLLGPALHICLHDLIKCADMAVASLEISVRVSSWDIEQSKATGPGLAT